jgi:hypothetical protein
MKTADMDTGPCIISQRMPNEIKGLNDRISYYTVPFNEKPCLSRLKTYLRTYNLAKWHHHRDQTINRKGAYIISRQPSWS